MRSDPTVCVVSLLAPQEILQLQCPISSKAIQSLNIHTAQ